jgi:hypothetical protein
VSKVVTFVTCKLDFGKRLFFLGKQLDHCLWPSLFSHFSIVNKTFLSLTLPLSKCDSLILTLLLQFALERHESSNELFHPRVLCLGFSLRLFLQFSLVS